MHFITIRMRSNRNYTVSTKIHSMESIPIFTSVYQKVFRLMLNQVGHIGKTSTFFDTDDIWMFRQTKQGIWSHFNNHTTWNVINNNRQIRCVCNGFKVLVHTFLGWFIVVRNNRKTSCKTTKLSYFFDELDRVTCVICTNTRN